MKILKARIDWKEDWDNFPRIEVLVDTIPASKDLRYQAIPVRSGTVYYSSLNGYVRFFYHNPRDQHGYGGRVFNIILKDGSRKSLKGPWSSGSSSMHSLGLGSCVEVSLTDDTVVYDRGHTFYAGHMTVGSLKGTIENIPDAWLIKHEFSNSHIYVVSRSPSRYEKPRRLLDGSVVLKEYTHAETW